MPLLTPASLGLFALRRLLLEAREQPAEADPAFAIQRGLRLHRETLDRSPVLAVEVGQMPSAFGEGEPRVTAGDAVVVEHDVAVGIAADHGRSSAPDQE